jgi:predicted transcriptional regulator
MIVTVVTTNNLTAALAALGLNDYEARVYLALLPLESATAYELGKRAGVPLSRCYEVARALAKKGLAAVQPGETPRYRAVDPRRALEERHRELDRLASELAERAARDDREPVWTLQGRGSILATARALVSAARSRVALSAPHDAVVELEGAIAQASRRGVSVELEETSALLLVVDDAEALLGELAPPGRALATHLRQRELVALLARAGDRERSGNRLTAARAPASQERGTDEALPQDRHEADWLDWESRKVRRLLGSVPGLAHLDGD